jgi:serine/threonine protein kinase
MGETEGGSVGSIQIRERIGSSGLYLAEQPALGRRVVVRKLRRDLLANASLVAQLEREAQLASMVSHPNVVAVFDFFSLRGDQYLVMEHVDGLSLDLALRRAGRVPPRIATLLLEQIARGVEALHNNGIVHSDLRPKNVLLGRWGEVKLCGLGAAWEISEGAQAIHRDPTSYSSPELRAHGKVDPSCDVFALGVLVGEMLTGEVRTDWDRVRPSNARRLAKLGRRCVHANPARRPSISELRASLESLGPRSNANGPSAEIAAWLWEITREPEGGVKRAEVDAGRPVRRSRTLQPTRLLAASVALALGGAAWLALAPLSQRESSERPPVDAGKVGESRDLFVDLDAAEAEQRARIRFAAYPWAEVSIDRGDPFLTPRAQHVELAPGRYEIAFRHPGYGEFRRVFHFEPGEERVVRHVFGAAELP